VRILGQANGARVGDTLQAGRDIDAVPEYVVVFDDDVADMQTDAEFDALVLGQAVLRSAMPS